MVDPVSENNNTACKTESNQDAMPLVSIGLPVYNEERFVEQSLLALLGQDYPNLEFIISDNGSDDDTVSIIERICNNDKRVHLHKFPENRGAMCNVDYVMKNSTGKYFMWSSGHDLWSKNLVSECCKLLEENTGAVLAYGTPVWIDENGKPMERQDGWTDTRGLDTVGRFLAVLWGSMNPVLGLIRRDALPDMDSYYTGVGVDLVLLLELILKGDFMHARKTEFFRRQPRQTESYAEKLSRYKSDDLQMTRSLFSKVFPLIRLPYEIIRTIIYANIGFGIKLALLLMVVPAFPIRYIIGRQSKE